MSAAPESARRFARWPLALAGVWVVVLACEPLEPPARLFFEDFEDACEGLPCGWARLGGEPAQATWVETIHPGEHAIRLEGEVAIRSTDESAIGDESLFGSSASVRMAARCTAGASLRVDVVFVDSFGARRTGTATLNPDTEWSRITRGDLDLDDWAEQGRVEAVVIRKNGNGTCEVGELVIDDDFQDRVSCQ